jgi:purine nucleosidase
MTPTEQEQLRRLGPLGRFVADINRQVDEYSRVHSGLVGFDLPDPIAMTVAIDPSVATVTGRHHVAIGLEGVSRGATIVDHRPVALPANATIAWDVDELRFKQRLFEACTPD